jgi:hypothetical protein
MMRNWFWLLISAATAAAAAPPERVDLTFDVRHNGSSVAQVEHRLRHDGRSYEITETWSGKGLYALLVVTLLFCAVRIGVWQERTATMQYKGDPRVVPLPADASDRLAFLFDFAFSPPPEGEVPFDLMDGRGKSRHLYRVEGAERLGTPAGEFDTVRLVRRTEDEVAEIWLATRHSYLPLRVRVTERDGAYYDQVITRIASP